MAAGRNRRRARATKAQHPTRRPKSKQCPATGKLGYASRLDAVMAMALFSRSERFKGQRVYRCPFCGRWHATSQAKRSDQAP